MRIIVSPNNEKIFEKIVSEIREDIKNGRRVNLVVPEQFTVQSEFELMKMLNIPSIIDLEVISFTRLASIVSQSLWDRNKYLGKIEKKVLLEKILEEYPLEFFASNHNKTKLLEKIGGLIDKLKDSGIFPEELESFYKKDENSVISKKIKDISRTYKRYLEVIGNSYCDRQDIMKMLRENISIRTDLYDIKFYFFAFLKMSPIELQVLKEMENCGIELTVTVLMEEKLIDKQKSSGVFASSVNYFNDLKKLTENISLEVLTEGEISKREWLTRSIFDYGVKSKAIEFDEFKFFRAANIEEEVENVALTILKLIDKKKYSYSDFFVVSTEISKYNPWISRIFNELNIKYHMNEQKQFSDTLFGKFIYSFLTMLITKDVKDILVFLNTGLTDISEDEVFELSRDIKKYNLEGKNIFIPDILVHEESNNNMACIAHRKFTKLIKNIKEKLQEKNSSENLKALIISFFDSESIQGRREEVINEFRMNKRQDLIDENEEVWKKFTNVLEQLEGIFKETNITLYEFISYAIEAFDEITIGKLPQVQDQVAVGDLYRSRGTKCKILFFMGMSDAFFPSKIGTNFILKEEEKQILVDNGLNFVMVAKDILDEENIRFYDTLLRATENVYLSYSISDSQNRSMRPSRYYRRILELLNMNEEDEMSKISKDKIFYSERMTLNCARDLLVDESTDSAQTLYEYIFDEVKKKIPEDTKPALKELPKEIVQELYPKNLSASKIGVYSNCAYEYFVSQGLRPIEEDEYTVNLMEIGTIIHYVLEKMTAKIREENNFLSEEEIKKLVNKEFNKVVNKEILKYRLESKKNVFFLNLLKEESFKLAKLVQTQLMASKFVIAKEELPFGRTWKEDVPFKIEADEKEYSFSGIIDRIDVFKQGETLYYKVIDYKTGNKEFSIERALNGLDLQLLIYILAIKNIVNDNYGKKNLYHELTSKINGYYDREIEHEIKIKPAGAFYSILKLINNDGNLKIPKMTGFLLDNEEVANAMDENYSDKEMSTIKLAIKKDNVLNEDEINTLIEDAEKVIKKLIKEMFDGKIGTEAVVPDYLSSVGISNSDYFGDNIKYIAKKSWKDIKNQQEEVE